MLPTKPRGPKRPTRQLSLMRGLPPPWGQPSWQINSVKKQNWEGIYHEKGIAPYHKIGYRPTLNITLEWELPSSRMTDDSRVTVFKINQDGICTLTRVPPAAYHKRGWEPCLKGKGIAPNMGGHQNVKLGKTTKEIWYIGLMYYQKQDQIRTKGDANLVLPKKFTK